MRKKVTLSVEISGGGIYPEDVLEDYMLFKLGAINTFSHQSMYASDLERDVNVSVVNYEIE